MKVLGQARIKLTTPGSAIGLTGCQKCKQCKQPFLTYLAYMSQCLKISYIKQYSHNYESAWKALTSLCQLLLQNDISRGARWCNIKTLHIHVNVCDSPTIGGISSVQWLKVVRS